MRKVVLFLILSVFLTYACSKKETHKTASGYLTLNISQSTSLKNDIDINEFILKISDSRGALLEEYISDLPERIELPVGSYVIEAYSIEFSEPKFDTPFYLGRTVVEIVSGETREASLVCSQGNAGIKLVWSNDFRLLFSTYHAQIRCNEGYLSYSSTETRTGYFLPGTVTVTILADGQTINGGTITLAAKDMVTVALRPKDASSSGNISISMSIDETVNERDEEIIIDPEDINTGANSETNPYTIAQAIAKQGETEVWVVGYIVGAKPSSGYNFVNPDTWQATNIVLADNIAETNDNNVVFVELLSGSKYRTNLNLMDHAANLHRRVLIKGNLLQYQSRSGLRNLKDYSFQ
jgi:hypothetical protein